MTSICQSQVTFGDPGDDLTEIVKSASTLPDTSFQDVTIMSLSSSFAISIQSDDQKACARLAMQDYGEDSIMTQDDCANGGGLLVAFRPPGKLNLLVPLGP